MMKIIISSTDEISTRIALEMQQPWEDGRLKKCCRQPASVERFPTEDAVQVILGYYISRCPRAFWHWSNLPRPPGWPPMFYRERYMRSGRSGRSGDLTCRSEASGIDFEAREVESTKPPEPRWKIWRVTWSHQISCMVGIAVPKTAGQMV